MFDQRLADLERAALHHRKGAPRQAAFRYRGGDRFGDEFGGTGVGFVALHDHRAAGGEGRCGVATRGGERQREVGGAEHGDRAERSLHQLQIGAGCGLAVGQRFVVATVEVVAFPDVAGEHAQLAGRAAAFAVETRGRQSGFRSADFGDRRAPAFDLVGDGFQEHGAGFRIGIAIGPERLFGGADRPVDEGRVARAIVDRRAGDRG